MTDLDKIVKKLSITPEEAEKKVSEKVKSLKKESPTESDLLLRKKAINLVYLYGRRGGKTQTIGFEGMIWGGTGQIDIEEYERKQKVEEATKKYKLELSDLKAKKSALYNDAIAAKVINIEGELLKKDGTPFKANGNLKRTLIGLGKPLDSKEPRLILLNLWGEKTELDVPRFVPVEFKAINKTDEKTTDRYVLNSGVDTEFVVVKKEIPDPLKQKEGIFKTLGFVKDIKDIDKWFSSVNDDKLKEIAKKNDYIFTQGYILRTFIDKLGRKSAMLDSLERDDDYKLDDIKCDLSPEIANDVNKTDNEVIVVGIPKINNYNADTKETDNLRRLSLKTVAVYEINKVTPKNTYFGG
jgi:hypothetical protein